MSDVQRIVTAAKFKTWYEKLADIWKEESNRRAAGNKLAAASLLHKLDRIGQENGVLETADFPTSVAENLERKYRLKQEFDWKNETIVIGPASWREFSGSAGLIAEIERATGISEHD